MNRRYLLLVVFIGFTLMLYSAIGIGQQRAPTDPDGAQEAQTPRQVQLTRPEQQPTSHDQFDIFSPNDVPPSSTAFETQPDQRKMGASTSLGTGSTRPALRTGFQASDWNNIKERENPAHEKIEFTGLPIAQIIVDRSSRRNDQ